MKPRFRANLRPHSGIPLPKRFCPPRPGALPLDHAGGSAPILPLYPYPSHSVLAMWLTQPMNTFHAPVSHDLKASLQCIQSCTGWPKKVVHFSTHHIFGTVEDKMKRISPKCSQNFWEQSLSGSFMQLLNILSKLASVLLYPKTLLPRVQLMIFLLQLCYILCNLIHSFTAVIRNSLCINTLKHFSPHINYVVTLPC